MAPWMRRMVSRSIRWELWYYCRLIAGYDEGIVLEMCETREVDDCCRICVGYETNLWGF
jgi:hypothetical protein